MSSSNPECNFATAGGDTVGNLSEGQGGDHLGNDRLPGDSGLDIHLLGGSVDSDLLLDERGGAIRYHGHALTGGQETAPGSGEWEEGAVRYHLFTNGHRQDLLITAGTDTLLVRDWRCGHLGIRLQGAPADPPSPTAELVLHGDRTPLGIDQDQLLGNGRGRDMK